MQKGSLTREQVVRALGEKLVDAVERKSCEPTGRVGYNGLRGDDLCEWAASVVGEDADGNEVVLVAYYYTTNEQDQIMAECGDWSCIDWELAGFEIA